MEKIKEENKSLIALRNNYFNVIILLISGSVGLFFSSVNTAKFIVLLILGIYFTMVFIIKFQYINNRLNKNFEELNK